MDAISRFIDCDDWGVSLHFSTHMLSGAPILFMGLQILTTLSRPVSGRLYWNAGCEGVDASCYGWVWENNWLELLVFLIPRVIRYLAHCKAAGALIVPEWVSSRSVPCSSGSSLLTPLNCHVPFPQKYMI